MHLSAYRVLLILILVPVFGICIRLYADIADIFAFARKCERTSYLKRPHSGIAGEHPVLRQFNFGKSSGCVPYFADSADVPIPDRTVPDEFRAVGLGKIKVNQAVVCAQSRYLHISASLEAKRLFPGLCGRFHMEHFRQFKRFRGIVDQFRNKRVA